MHSKTKSRVEFLQSVVRKRSKAWYKKYGENLTGIRVDKKRKRGESKNYYSIVFKVIEKKKGSDLVADQIIPKSVKVLFPDGIRRKIMTDVRQTGKFEFHCRIMDQVRDGQTGEPGALGLMLRDRLSNIFGLTNFHVAAHHLVRQGIHHYDARNSGENHKVEVSGRVCRLYKGAFESNLDAAFVYLGSNLSVGNSLPDGFWIDNTGFIEGPIPISAKNKIVTLYLPSRNGKITRPIQDNNLSIRHRLMRFIDLIAVSRCSRGGDSGSLAVMDGRKVLGIVIGGDEEFTYIIPYYKIHSFFPLQII